MVSLMELLPLMVDKFGKPEGWKPYQNSETLTLTPGKTKHIGPTEQPGWVRFLILETNNRYTSLQHTIWEKAMVYTPYQLFSNGDITPGPTGVPWVQTYIVADELYKIVWEPVPPQEFLFGADIWVTAPNRNPVTGADITTNTVITLTWHLVRIFDHNRFLASMKEVLTREISATEIAAVTEIAATIKAEITAATEIAATIKTEITAATEIATTIKVEISLAREIAAAIKEFLASMKKARGGLI